MHQPNTSKVLKNYFMLLKTRNAQQDGLKNLTKVT